MTTLAEIAVKDSSTSTNVPVEGLPVTETLSNPSGSQVFRQTIAIADGAGGTATANFASVSSPTADANSAGAGLWNVTQPVLYNGSTWDRWRCDATGKAQVSLYGKNSSAGDTALSLNSSGYANVVAGGKTAKVAVTPTVTASSAYAAGNEVGGLMTFSSALLTAGSGVLLSIGIRSKSVQTAPFVLALFDTNPTNSTWTNKAAPAINASDIPFLVGIYELATAFSSMGTHTIYNLNGVNQGLAAGATTLYGVLATLGTPTFGSTSDITVVLTILQD